jgi:hypothetical protein
VRGSWLGASVHVTVSKTPWTCTKE